MSHPDYVSAADACRIAGVDRSTLIRWAKKGRIEPVMRLGAARTSAYLFRRSDVEALAKKAA